MKKIYVKPTLEVELVEAGELMTGSNPGNANYQLGGGNGDSHYEGGGISGTGEGATDDGWDVGAKGSFACWEDEGDWAL